jgi:hypothetical protein
MPLCFFSQSNLGVFAQNLGFCFFSKLERRMMSYRFGNKVNFVELCDQHIFYIYFNENIYEFFKQRISAKECI